MTDNNDANLTYTEALAELESILASLRSDNCDVDTLAERALRASRLLKLCRSRLTRTEKELAKVLEELDNVIEG
ncbi:MAG: exodeoxyribonuclease VII small subunit [Muribaculaceae bacterium]|nr:exodeoxyribonuclease VII small subunit [Muribaculaceae bacterium]MDE6526424.1 exodeoxyribonuclease VII small subunit [Muribaculaceae bacterium]MDE6612091.1 exodeoxyribonuclease VII small subunit [Muribaculaceae bacterium]